MPSLDTSYSEGKAECTDLPIRYAGKTEPVPMGFIMELRPFKQSAGIEAEDVAKGLMDIVSAAPTL